LRPVGKVDGNTFDGFECMCSWKDVFWLRNYDPVAMPFAFLTVLVVLFGAGFIIKQILPAKKN